MFIYFVVVAVVYAVDLTKPTVPASPLPISYPPLGEANHPGTIGIHAVAEVELLYLNLVHTGCHGSNDVLRDALVS
jgi:hypothetical protein